MAKVLAYVVGLGGAAASTVGDKFCMAGKLAQEQGGFIVRFAMEEGENVARVALKARNYAVKELVANKDILQATGGIMMIGGGAKMFFTDSNWRVAYVDARINEAMGPAASTFMLNKVQIQNQQMEDLKRAIQHSNQMHSEDLRRLKDKTDALRASHRKIQQDQAALRATLKANGYDMGVGADSKAK